MCGEGARPAHHPACRWAPHTSLALPINTQLLDTAGQRLLDQTVRNAGVGWSSWANVQTSTAGGVLVVMSCQVLLSAAGLHTFNVSYLNVAQRQSR